MAFVRKPIQQLAGVELQDGLLLTQSGLRESVCQEAALSAMCFPVRHEDVLRASGRMQAEYGILAHFLLAVAIDAFPRGLVCVRQLVGRHADGVAVLGMQLEELVV